MWRWLAPATLSSAAWAAVRESTGVRGRRVGGPQRRGAASADDLVAGEELRDLLGGGVGRVGAVHRVLADRARVNLADGAGCSLGGIGRAHDVAIFRDRILTFQHLHDDRNRDHEIDQLAEER